MNTSIAFRLIGISSDLDILRTHLEFVEEQTDQMRLFAEDIRDSLLEDISSLGESDRQAQWQFAEGVYDSYVEFRLPRILYYPFIVSLYTVYESAVKEIAILIQERNGENESLASTKGRDFLDCANKYCRSTIGYELSLHNQSWERIRILIEIRHAIVHANGHLELVREGKRRQIRKWMEQDIGIEDDHGQIIVSEAFVRETFEIVRSELEGLIKNFKEWNNTTEAF